MISMEQIKDLTYMLSEDILDDVEVKMEDENELYDEVTRENAKEYLWVATKEMLRRNIITGYEEIHEDEEMAEYVLECMVNFLEVSPGYEDLIHYFCN